MAAMLQSKTGQLRVHSFASVRENAVRPPKQSVYPEYLRLYDEGMGKGRDGG